MPTPAFSAYYAKATIEAATWRRYGEMLTRLGQAADRGLLEAALALADGEITPVREFATRRAQTSASLRAVR
jgi:hypothetical protein